MGLATGSHTVLVFKETQFLGNWTRWSGTNAIGYTANGRRNWLLVVVEGATGTMATYFLSLCPALMCGSSTTLRTYRRSASGGFRATPRGALTERPV
jgi:hypothetical protein